MIRSSRGWTHLKFLAVGAMLLAALAAIVPAAQQARTNARLMQQVAWATGGRVGP